LRKTNFALPTLLIIAAAALGFDRPLTIALHDAAERDRRRVRRAALPQAIPKPFKTDYGTDISQGQPTIAELSQPMLRLAGARVNPRNNGPHRATEIYAITLKKIADGQ